MSRVLFAWELGANLGHVGPVAQIVARCTAVLGAAYGQCFQSPDYDQRAGWQTANYGRLAVSMYSRLPAETYVERFFEAIDWAQSAVTRLLFGDLSAVQVILNGEIAHSAAQSTRN